MLFRSRRICTNQADFDSNCQELKTTLLNQKYPEQVIDDAITRANGLNRTEILHKKASNPNPPTNLVLTHSASAPDMSTVLRKHYNILTQSERLKSVFPEPPRVVYRRNKNIGDSLTKSSISRPRTIGCMPCNKPRCKVCPQMTTAQRAASTASDYCVNVKGNFNCDTANVVYLLECTICGQNISAKQKHPSVCALIITARMQKVSLIYLCHGMWADPVIHLKILKLQF